MDNGIREISLGGREFRVGPLPFGDLEILFPLCSDLNKPMMAGGWVAMQKIVGLALKDQIEKDDLAVLRVRVSDIKRAVDVIIDVSGMVELGELMAARNNSHDGSISTPPLPLPPGGTPETSGS